MIIYKCIFSGDELFSDALKVKEVDDIVYEVEGKYVKESDACGIPSNDDGEGLDDGERTVINVVSAHKLSQTTITKPQYQAWLKAYMAKLKAHLEANNPDRVKPFMTAAANFAKKILTTFKDYDFYQSESLSDDGQIIILGYGADGQTPTFYFWKDGLKQEKF